MKLFRHGEPGKEFPGILLNENEHRDIRLFGEDFNENFFATNGISRLKDWLKTYLNQCPVISPVTRFGPAIVRPSKIVCIGLNYTDHATETKAQVPPEPVLFFKSTTAIIGPNDDVTIPKGSSKTDWEVELAIVIG
jgi:2-keto-4-pentenoate hydratase/2-oxohepta-3-ene-1,7-dioic acid hydratase in catechol pathway